MKKSSDNNPNNSSNDDGLLKPPGERNRKDENNNFDESPFQSIPDDPLEVLSGDPPPPRRSIDDEKSPEELEEEERERHRQFAAGNGLGGSYESTTSSHRSSEGDVVARDTSKAVEIHLETEGRFDTPAIIFCEDFNIEGLNSIASSTEDSLLETLMAVVNRQLYDGVKSENMLPEEFLETLYAIKQKDINIATHKHYWIHRCPDREPGEEPKLSTAEIPLRGEGSLRTRSISDCEQELRKIMSESFKLMTADEFQLYLKNKYGNETTIHTKEEELKRITVKEPFTVKDGQDVYKIRFARMKDTLKAQREGNQRFSGKLRAIKSKQVHGMNPMEIKSLKDEEIKKVNLEKQQFISLYTRSQTLISKNNKKLSDDEKYQIYRKISREAVTELSKYLKIITFGLVDERTLVCEHCHNSERRSLHRDFHPIEFIPVEERNSNLDPKAKLGVHTKVNIYFGS